MSGETLNTSVTDKVLSSAETIIGKFWLHGVQMVAVFVCLWRISFSQSLVIGGTYQ